MSYSLIALGVVLFGCAFYEIARTNNDSWLGIIVLWVAAFVFFSGLYGPPV